MEALFSGAVPFEEALRGVSQALTMADAGGCTRILGDVRAVLSGPSDMDLVAAALATRSGDERIAILCSPAQLGAIRRFARRTGLRQQLGLFTRETDARAWLAGPSRTALSPTMRRHLGGGTNEAAAGEPATRRRGAA